MCNRSLLAIHATSLDVLVLDYIVDYVAELIGQE